jgi:hypothetical protein
MDDVALVILRYEEHLESFIVYLNYNCASESVAYTNYVDVRVVG